MLPFFMSFIYILNKIMSKSKTSGTIFDSFKNRSNDRRSGWFSNGTPDGTDVFSNGPLDGTDVFSSPDGTDVFSSLDGTDVFSSPDGNADVFGTSGNADLFGSNTTSSSGSSSTNIIGSLSSVSSGVSSGVSSVAGFFGSIYNMLPNASSSTLTSKINMEFLKPNLLQVPSVIFLLVILLVFIVLISYWAYIKSNWEQVKCKDGRFWIAPLFGKSTQETIKDCTTKEIQLTVNKNLQSEIERLAELDDSVSNLQALLADNESNTSSLRSDTNSTLTNITNILESNINYVKGALSTILASIYISSNLNKGALTSYADLQTSDIAEIIDKYNNVNMDEANLNFI